MTEPVCPDCGAKNVQKSSAVVDSGTTHSVFDQNSASVSTSGVGLEAAKGSGVSITSAAKKNSAPNNDEADIGALILGALIGFFLSYMIGASGIGSISIVIVTALFVLGAYVHSTQESRNENLMNYSKQWYCHSCGHIFHR